MLKPSDRRFVHHYRRPTPLTGALKLLTRVPFRLTRVKIFITSRKKAIFNVFFATTAAQTPLPDDFLYYQLFFAAWKLFKVSNLVAESD